MAELKRRVNTYRLDYECDKCKQGFLQPTGYVQTSLPPRYGHRCRSCGDETMQAGVYPREVTELVEEK